MSNKVIENHSKTTRCLQALSVQKKKYELGVISEEKYKKRVKKYISTILKIYS